LAATRVPLNLYEQQRRNVRRTRMFLAAFVAFLAFLGWGTDQFLLRGGWFCTIAALALGGISAGWALKNGDRAVLNSTRAVPLDPVQSSHRMLDNVVEEMAIASGLPKPKVYVIPDPDPNAFATGSGPDRSSVAVTQGLLDTLNREELQAVVSHEMAHVKNFDIRLMTVVAALLGAVLLVSDFARRGMRWGGLGGGGRRKSSDKGGGGGGAVMLVLFAIWVLSVILAPFIAQLVAMAVSREREYLADASGSELTRNPLALASALEKIAAHHGPTGAIKQGVAHLCIEDPKGRDAKAKEEKWMSFLASHPPVAKRVAILKEMGYRQLAAP
jgi:heat shock protein HtpX